MFGREPILPSDVNLGLPRLEYENEDCYITKTVEILKKVFNQVNQNLVNERRNYEEYTDARRKLNEFEVNDLVMVHTPTRKKGRSENLMHTFHGPYRVIEKLSSLVYRVTSLESNDKKIVPLTRMKKYHQRNIVEPEVFIDIKPNQVRNDLIVENDSVVDQNLRRSTRIKKPRVVMNLVIMKRI